MSALELQAYEIFKTRFGEKEAATVIEYFEAKADKKYEEKKDMLLTKDDKMDLIAKIEATHTKIESTKTDMIKWFFAFFITLALMMAGLYFKD